MKLVGISTNYCECNYNDEILALSPIYNNLEGYYTKL